MVVDRDVHGGILEVRLYIGDEVVHFVRGAVADRVGDVDRRGARRDRRVEHLDEEVAVAAGGVLGRKFNVRAEAAREPDHPGDAGDDLVGGHLELVFHVNVARREKDVDARMRGVPDRVPRALDVPLDAAREPRDGGILDDLGDRLDRPEVVGRRDREARLDDVHAQPLELARHLQLLVEVHAASRGLFPVPQGGVEDLDRSCAHGDFPFPVIRFRETSARIAEKTKKPSPLQKRDEGFEKLPWYHSH